MPVALTPLQLEFLQAQFGTLMRLARAKGIADQDMCEWMLSLGGRWLHAHGVSREHVHTWMDREMRDTRSPVPLVAAAAAKNDFGSKRS